jgi:hypothetical protein
MVKNPNFLKNLEEYVHKAKPDAYYFEIKERVRDLVVEMKRKQLTRYLNLLSYYFKE